MNTQTKTSDQVNHPSHYTWLKEKCGLEVIDITKHFDFVIGNCIKYILRAGKKMDTDKSMKEKQIEDLRKARWYLDYRINELQNEEEKGFSDGL